MLAHGGFSTRPYLQVKAVSKQFSGVQALEDVSITIGKGEIWCLAGENGSGKSTLIKIVAGVHRPDTGSITINGTNYPRLRPIDAIRHGVQVIYQDFSLFPNLTVAENIAMTTQLDRNRRFVNWRGVYRIARDALEQIGCTLDLRQPVAALSVADRQLVSIARALLDDVRLLIMDEPTTALTQREVDALFTVIKGLKERGVSILFVSHKLNEVLQISEKIAILRNGRKVAEGAAAAFDHGKLVYHMTGRSYRETDTAPPSTAGGTKPILGVEHLTRGDQFRDVSFQLSSGEILGLAGLLGSGRTALAHSIFGLNPADAGTIAIEGRSRGIHSVKSAIKAGIAYVPDDRLTEGLFLEQSIERNLVVSILADLVNRLRLIRFTKVRQHVETWLEKLNVATPAARAPVQTLSGGNQQKIVLGRWLAAKTAMLILNRPTVGVDVGAKADIHRTIRELARDGVGILLISDDIPELLALCHRIALMHRGRIIEEFARRDCDEDTLLNRMRTLN